MRTFVRILAVLVFMGGLTVACCEEEKELSDAASTEAAAPTVGTEAAAREEAYWAEKPSDNP